MWMDAKEFEEHVNKFVSAHKIINITYAIRQGHAGSFVAFIEYEETDGTEPEGKKIKELEEERDKYRNMVFDKNDQLTKAKEIIKQYLFCYGQKELPSKLQIEAEQFLKEEKENGCSDFGW